MSHPSCSVLTYSSMFYRILLSMPSPLATDATDTIHHTTTALGLLDPIYGHPGTDCTSYPEMYNGVTSPSSAEGYFGTYPNRQVTLTFLVNPSAEFYTAWIVPASTQRPS